MKFTVTDELVTKNHVVRVIAVYDGKNKPVASASMSGFGDSLHRELNFKKKDLEDAMRAIDAARSTVEKVQRVADRWYEEVTHDN